MTQQSKPATRELKPEQKTAAYTLDKHVSVTAGPGSGKTTVLVERYLSILKTKHVSIEQVVAITFTNRAANEMRSRLRKEFDRLLRTAEPYERRMWLRHKRTLDSALITTIHGFCSRLLREFPLEAGIDPQFTLLDEHRAAMLEDTIAEELISAYLDEGHKVLTQLTLFLGREHLGDSLLRLYRKIRGVGLDLDQVEDSIARGHANDEQYRACLAELDLCMGEFLELPGLSPAAEKHRLAALEQWPAFRSYIETMPELENALQFRDLLEDFRAATRPVARGNLKGLVERLDGLIWGKDSTGRLPQICFDQFAKRYADGLVEVIRKIERRLNDEKRKLAVLSFDDLEITALNLLRSREDVRRRIADRYRYYLVDEFQDTNALQQELVDLLALGNGRANLFVVGDPKQSIYGFRGADVNVFNTITAKILDIGGIEAPLRANFRSRPQLIAFFNFIFNAVFEVGDVPEADLPLLGYVKHEDGIAERENTEDTPLIEVQVDVRSPSKSRSEGWSEGSTRQGDAQQISNRIVRLVSGDDRPEDPENVRSPLDGKYKYGQIAMLFRAMSEVGVYESALRRAGIPYRTVAGRGFYQREEVNDLLQLLRFLDNTTDELALATVLRSPICSISDDALMALRCEPANDNKLKLTINHKTGVRPLYKALEFHESIDFIAEEDRQALQHSRALLANLVENRFRLSIPELLRLTLQQAEYLSVIAGAYDGALRVANVEKLVSLSEQFARSGAFTVRDFVRFVNDFEKRGGREGEGSLDESIDAVTLMTVHQSKGQEFPVVILPELHRLQRSNSDSLMLDRHRGLTLRVPDGRGGVFTGLAFSEFRERAALRERFESMRVLYVAATRAKDLLILSGSAEDPTKLADADNNWLSWIWRALANSQEMSGSGNLIVNGANVRLQLNSFDPFVSTARDSQEPRQDSAVNFDDPPKPIEDYFPLLKRVPPENNSSSQQFNVTDLLSFDTCPRLYYLQRILRLADPRSTAAVTTDEEPSPFSIAAMLKGSIIHRFCETYRQGDDLESCLESSLDYVFRLRAAELESEMIELDKTLVLNVLRPLAMKYSRSSVFERVEQTARLNMKDGEGYGVYSEKPFILLRKFGLLKGTVDKLLVTPSPDGNGVDVEIVDFKTNRIDVPEEIEGLEADNDTQGFLPFDRPHKPTAEELLEKRLEELTQQYLLQMQCYALAAHLLIPDINELKATLHFLDKEREYPIQSSLLDGSVCGVAVDKVMTTLNQKMNFEDFVPRTGEHCRRCSYLSVCPSGRVAVSKMGLVVGKS
jgi:ATP-dependent helicase/nuclease subunit A